MADDYDARGLASLVKYNEKAVGLDAGAVPQLADKLRVNVSLLQF